MRKTGHRLIEIACIEIEDLLPTGRSFHRFIDPERDIDPEAEKVHGISRQRLLHGKPKFADSRYLARQFLSFIGDAPLIAHNAAFDRGFINVELEMRGTLGTFPRSGGFAPTRWRRSDILECTILWIRFVNGSSISLAEREKHGALIDTRLLAMVYLELQGGKERGLNLAPTQRVGATIGASVAADGYGPRPRPLAPRSTVEERAAHAAFVASVLKDKAVWLKFADT